MPYHLHFAGSAVTAAWAPDASAVLLALSGSSQLVALLPLLMHCHHLICQDVVFLNVVLNGTLPLFAFRMQTGYIHADPYSCHPPPIAHHLHLAGSAVTAAAWAPDASAVLLALSGNSQLVALYLVGQPPNLTEQLLPVSLPGVSDMQQ
jgi:hypothetical protein